MKKLSLVAPIFYLIIITSFFNKNVTATDRKSYSTNHTSLVPKIDGELNDDCWKNVNSVNDFLTFLPQFGKQPTYKTDVKIIYDDDAIYISAKCLTIILKK